MSEQIEQMMRQVKLGGMAKEWRSVPFEDPEQYVTALLMLELKEREANRINRMVKTAGFRVLKTLDDFVWNTAIELPSGLTKEYMEDLSKGKPDLYGGCWYGENPSCYSHCAQSLPGRSACPFLHSSFSRKHPFREECERHVEHIPFHSKESGTDCTG